MKLISISIILFLQISLSAQDIPFIKAAQLEQWLNADTDTVYVLNFWATWCGPCVAELPAFEKLNEKYAAKKVKVVLISTDFKRNVESNVKPFVKRKNLQSQVVFMDESNPNVWVNLVSPEWSGAIPATLIISKRNGKRLFFEKQMNFKELEEKLLSVL
jgi:thiol-disulfide isomerase/thioredoxin